MPLRDSMCSATPPLAFPRLSQCRLGKSRATDRQTREFVPFKKMSRDFGDFSDRKLVDYWRITPQGSGIR